MAPYLTHPRQRPLKLPAITTHPTTHGPPKQGRGAAKRSFKPRAIRSPATHIYASLALFKLKKLT